MQTGASLSGMPGPSDSDHNVFLRSNLFDLCDSDIDELDVDALLDIDGEFDHYLSK